MIKKILLTLGIFGLSIIGYSNAVFPEPIMSGKFGNGYGYSVYEMDIPGQFNDAFYENKQGYVYNNVDGLLNIENNQILIKSNTEDNRYFTFGRVDGKLYGLSNATSTIYGQGYLRICEGTYSDNGYFNNCMYSNNNILTNNYNVNIDDIEKNITFDKLIFIPYTDIYNRIQGIGNYCFASSTSDYVFCILYSINNGNSGFTGANNLVSQVKQGTGAKYDIFDNSSPFLGGGNGGSDSPISGGQSPITGGYSYMNCTNQNVLAYYIKTFGYNYTMCNIVSGGVAEGYYPYGTLKEFCNIIYIFENEDLNYLNKPYTGHNKNIVCDSPSSYFDYSGDNVNSIDWSGEFSGTVNSSGQYEVQSSDSFLINLTNVLKGNFYIPTSGDFGLGYLPRYIILGFMGVIFFNFLRK